ncbi:hypothetical protein C8T65DRAFT_98195 [Cerioporus squamosus]|nr:hypothetical protein C8T65DRAFT_98195 [Cerioporus squamosus]
MLRSASRQRVKTQALSHHQLTARPPYPFPASPMPLQRSTYAAVVLLGTSASQLVVAATIDDAGRWVIRYRDSRASHSSGDSLLDLHDPEQLKPSNSSLEEFVTVSSALVLVQSASPSTFSSVLLMLVLGTAWWWWRRMHAAKRGEILPVPVDFTSSTNSASSGGPLLRREEGSPAAGHSNQCSLVSTDAAGSATDVPMHALRDSPRAPLRDGGRHSLPEEATASDHRLTTIDARISLIPRPCTSELDARHLPRLTILDRAPGPDGLTPLSPRPRRPPHCSKNGAVRSMGGSASNRDISANGE